MLNYHKELFGDNLQKEMT